MRNIEKILECRLQWCLDLNNASYLDCSLLEFRQFERFACRNRIRGGVNPHEAILFNDREPWNASGLSLCIADEARNPDAVAGLIVLPPVVAAFQVRPDNATFG